MSQKPKPVPQDDPNNIISRGVTEEMSEAFLAYSMSVITSRALPDAKDGLKPVQRRILYSMYKSNLRPENPYVKSARVVGNTMSNYHPHGDSAIYEALVRMARDFAMRVTLVDGHGNFGTHRDSAAAQRYTECRMTAAAVSMVSNVEEDCVDMRDNYDGKTKEPKVLPAAIPNLLINGTSGIAVGMATSMPSHNPEEVVRACQAFLKNNNITIEQLREHILGPDLPTGGKILEKGLDEIYKTGKGTFTMRATVAVEQQGRSKTLVVTELPYQVGPETLCERINELKNQGKLPQVASVTDLSDRTGMRVHIQLKSTADATAVLEELYTKTPLEENFTVHNLALVDGKPKTLDLKGLVGAFCYHRKDVVLKRSIHRRAKAEAAAHILRGYLIILADINAVVNLIKRSKTTQEANQKLCAKYNLDTIQATAVLDMPLRRLTSLEITKIKADLKELEATIKALTAIIDNDKKLSQQVIDELEQTLTIMDTARRTTLLTQTAIKRTQKSVAVSSGPWQVFLNKNKLGKVSTTTKIDQGAIEVNAGETCWVITQDGILHPFNPEEILDSTAKNPKTDIKEFFETSSNAIGLIKSTTLTMVSTAGGVKRVKAEDLPKKPTPGVSLKENEKLLWAGEGEDEDTLTILLSTGKGINISMKNIPTKGLSAQTMIGVKTDTVPLTAGTGKIIHTITDGGRHKLTATSDIPVQGRGAGGVVIHKFLKNDTTLTEGYILEKSTHNIPVSTRGGSGQLYEE